MIGDGGRILILNLDAESPPTHPKPARTVRTIRWTGYRRSRDTDRSDFDDQLNNADQQTCRDRVDFDARPPYARDHHSMLSGIADTIDPTTRLD
jgi:hypothetical protein